MDWLDLLAVQGTLKSLLQHHSSKASILWCSALFTVQLSHPYMTTGKTTALTRWTFVGKVMSLLFNMLSRLVAQRVKCLPAMWETWVQFLCQEDPLEKEMATHSSTLAWKIPWTEKPGRLQSMGSQSQTPNLALLQIFPIKAYVIHSLLVSHMKILRGINFSFTCFL